MSRYYSDVFKFKNALLTLRVINLPFVNDNYKFDFTEVGRVSPFFKQIVRLSSIFLMVYFGAIFVDLSSKTAV